MVVVPFLVLLGMLRDLTQGLGNMRPLGARMSIETTLG